MRCDHCGSPALELVDDNGATDPAEGPRSELYRCDNGHSKFVYLEA